MTFDGVILYGPPASGKDTVTTELRKLSSIYVHFEKFKVGEGQTSEYRLVSEERLTELRNRGLIVHEVTRYGATYAVDSVRLDELFNDELLPVIHMGQVAGVEALHQHGGRWLDVLLWCPRDVAAERLKMRGSSDISERLSVWDQTLTDLGPSEESRFTLSIRTDALTPATSAAVIHAAIMGW
jgi:guanylate kinase